MTAPKFFICKKCGNIVGMVYDSKQPLSCCGEAMQELVPNTVDAAKEKHVPAICIDGNDLNKQQKTCDRFIDAIDAAPAPEYAVIAPLLNAKLAEKFTDKQYTAWQKAIKEQFGTLKEAQFRIFERLNDGSLG